MSERCVSNGYCTEKKCEKKKLLTTTVQKANIAICFISKTFEAEITAKDVPYREQGWLRALW